MIDSHRDTPMHLQAYRKIKDQIKELKRNERRREEKERGREIDLSYVRWGRQILSARM